MRQFNKRQTDMQHILLHVNEADKDAISSLNLNEYALPSNLLRGYVYENPERTGGQADS